MSAEEDEELARRLGEAAREDDVLADPRWDALACGTISAEDRAALEALAQRSDVAAEALRAFAPPDDEAHERMAAVALAALGAKAPADPVSHARERLPASSDALPANDASSGPANDAPSRPANDAPSRPPPSALRDRRFRVEARRSPRPGWMGAALVAAAAVVLGVMLRPGDEPALPLYAIEVAGGLVATRAEPAADAAPRLGPGSEIAIALRPATPIAGAVDARAFLVRDGRATPWDVPIAAADGGSLRVAGPFSTLFRGVSGGGVDVAFVVAPKGHLPALGGLARVAERGAEPPVQVVRHRVVIEP